MGKLSYLWVLQDARLIAVKKPNLENYLLCNYNGNDKLLKQELKKVYHPPYMHEVGVHAPGCFRGDRHRDAMFLQLDTEKAVMLY